MRMVAAGYNAPINTDLIETYDELAPFLKEQPNNSIDGTVYGIPHGWGANVLQYNTEVVDPAPTSWSVVLDADSPYAGKIAAYDSPIYIADAALYLMDTQPDLGIENPYALDQDQFDAAIDLLKEQKRAAVRVLERLRRLRGQLPGREHGAGHELADHHEHAPGATPARSTPCCPRRARRRGRTTG